MVVTMNKTYSTIVNLKIYFLHYLDMNPAIRFTALGYCLHTKTILRSSSRPSLDRTKYFPMERKDIFTHIQMSLLILHISTVVVVSPDQAKFLPLVSENK